MLLYEREARCSMFGLILQVLTVMFIPFPISVGFPKKLYLAALWKKIRLQVLLWDIIRNILFVRRIDIQLEVSADVAVFQSE